MTGPDEITPVFYAPKLELLPTNTMPWKSLELLLRRMAREVRGLRQVQVYGASGQSQFGLDIVGRAADGAGEAIQSKKYEKKFTKADLAAAVEKFVKNRPLLPFDVSRLVVAAGCVVDRREIVDELYRLNDEVDGVEIELWDQRSIGDMLRNRRDLVIEFFGESAADDFCLPEPVHVLAAPPVDKVDFADAVLRGPAKTTGAQGHLDEATGLESTDPGTAAEALLRAEELLDGGGFPAHAAVLRQRRAELLARAGNGEQAARLLSMHFWRELDAHRVNEAGALAALLDKVCGSGGPQALADMAEAAIRVVQAPLGLPEFDLDAITDDSVVTEAARVLLLMAETSAAEPGSTWSRDNEVRLSAAADAVEDVAGDDDDLRSLAHRLRIEVADATGDWNSLVKGARRRKLPRLTCALILARYAMYHAERDEFDEADESWEEAPEQACLLGRNDDAAEWVHSRRILHLRLRGVARDSDFWRLVRSLQTTRGDRSERTTQRLEAEALRAMVDGKPHVAVPVLRAYLRFAHATGNWGRVQDARSLLASAYQAAGVLEPAAALLILAGQAKQAAELAKRAGDRYLDVRPHLGASGASARAAAFRVLAVQGDLVPDDQVDEIAATALDVLRQERAGVLRDNPRYGPFVRLEALKVLAELADRITPEAAAELLDYLLPYVPREPNTYHHTDDSHVRACVGIAAGHPALRVAAIGQLLDLVAADDSGVSRKAEYEAHNLFLDYPELVRDRLGTLVSDGNRYAASLLSRITDEPREAQLNAAQAAGANLSAALDNTATSIGLGTDAERQALLAMPLPKEDRKNLVRIQLERVRSPYEPGWNRSDYFLAAGHLGHDLDDVDEFFEQAMEHAADSTPTAADLALNMGSRDFTPDVGHGVMRLGSA